MRVVDEQASSRHLAQHKSLRRTFPTVLQYAIAIHVAFRAWRLGRGVQGVACVNENFPS